MKDYRGFVIVTGFTRHAESHMDATTANNETVEKLSVFNTQNTGEQFVSQANGLGKWADEGTSIPLECHYAEFVSLKMCVHRNFIGERLGLVALQARVGSELSVNGYRRV
jgi:hypothetical protein